MKQKKKHIIRCECGKEIIGFSEEHAKINLSIHKQTSNRHKEIIKILKEKGVLRGENKS